MLFISGISSGVGGRSVTPEQIHLPTPENKNIEKHCQTQDSIIEICHPGGPWDDYMIIKMF